MKLLNIYEKGQRKKLTKFKESMPLVGSLLLYF